MRHQLDRLTAPTRCDKVQVKRSTALLLAHLAERTKRRRERKIDGSELRTERCNGAVQHRVQPRSRGERRGRLTLRLSKQLKRLRQCAGNSAHAGIARRHAIVATVSPLLSARSVELSPPLEEKLL